MKFRYKEQRLSWQNGGVCTYRIIVALRPHDAGCSSTAKELRTVTLSKRFLASVSSYVLPLNEQLATSCFRRSDRTGPRRREIHTERVEIPRAVRVAVMGQ